MIKSVFRTLFSISINLPYLDTAFSTSSSKALTVSTYKLSKLTLAERKCQDFEESMFSRHWESFWSKAFKRALADFSESKCVSFSFLSSDYYDCSTLHNWYQFISKIISFQGRFEEIHDYYVLI